MLPYLVFLIILYVNYDVNYFLRAFFTVLSGRVYQRKCTLKDITSIYGLCTFQDCDVSFRHIRLARLIRELDFARYHFYDRTGLYRRRNLLNIKSLQGCTLTLMVEPIPLFVLYKINTKLIYWDDKSLFFEHEVITLRDGKVRYLFVSRQHALGDFSNTTAALLIGIQGSEVTPPCPEYIKVWLEGMRTLGSKLKV